MDMNFIICSKNQILLYMIQYRSSYHWRERKSRCEKGIICRRRLPYSLFVQNFKLVDKVVSEKRNYSHIVRENAKTLYPLRPYQKPVSMPQSQTADKPTVS